MAKPRKLVRFTLKEISLVDRPAVQDGVVAAIRKRLDAPAKKAAPMTSEASGHRHEILITGNGQTGLSLALGEHTADGGEAHTHPAVRTRGGWTVGLAAGHSHTLPALGAVITRLLESDPGSEGEADEVGKGDTIDTPMTSIVGGHCHVIALAKADGFALHTSGSGRGGDSHAHKVSKQSDGSYQVEPGADGHTHELPGSPDALRKALKGSDPLSAAPESTENPTMTETAFEKSRRLAKAIEDDMDTLAEECRADFPELSPEQALFQNVEVR